MVGSDLSLAESFGLARSLSATRSSTWCLLFHLYRQYELRRADKDRTIMIRVDTDVRIVEPTATTSALGASVAKFATRNLPQTLKESE